MRLAFFLLVLANLLFFVWSAGYLGGQDEGREPQRLSNQLHPEAITVTVTPPAAAAPAPPPPAVPAAPATAVPVAAAQPAQGCRRIEGVAVKDGGPFQQSLQSAGFVVAVLPAEERGWWVSIPALPNKAAADKKAGELRALGIADFDVAPGEKGAFAITLGVFKDEASASQFLQSAMKKGVKSARLETRLKAATAMRLELRGPADLFAQRLPQLLGAAPGASAAECP
jgi:hypothetical protein